jgi:hypothetical protein
MAHSIKSQARSKKVRVPILTMRAPYFMVMMPMSKRTLSIQPMFRASETGRDCVHYLPALGNQEKVT